MRRLIVLVVGLQLLLVALSFAQQAQLTRLLTIGPDSTTATITRGAIEYLPSGVIWLATGNYPYTGVNSVYLSTDNGATWVKRSLLTNAGLSSPAVTGLTAKDANTCLVCTSTGEILRTTNGGVKWDTVTSYSTPDVAFCDGIKFVSGDTVVAYGDADAAGVFVARSVDAGKTWTRVPNVKASLPSDSLNSDEIYAGYASYAGAMDVYGRTIWCTYYNTSTDPPGILKSTDAGATWQWFRVTLPSGPTLNYYIRSITFKDANVGFAVSKRAYVNDAAHDNYLVKTTDGGRTWSDTISVQPGVAHVDAKPMTVKAIRGTNTVIAVGYGSVGAKSWISNDNGVTWAANTTPTPSTSADLRNIAFGSTSQGLAIGYYDMAKVAISGLASDSVNVTFRANAAVWQDTLSGATGLVQIRGTTMTAAGQSVDDNTTDTLSTGTIIAWNAQSTMNLTNVGGDYWQGTFKIKRGTKIAYKFFANAQNKTVKPNDGWENQGWEMNVVDVPGFYSTNRGLDLTGVTKDTVLPIQYINGIGHGAMKQYDLPYTTKDSTYVVYVRTDLAGWEDFNPANSIVAVRGSNKSDWGQTGELSWGPSYQLKQEGSSLFYSNAIHVPIKYATANMQFKFVIHLASHPLSEDWGNMLYNPNTQYDITTSGADTTIQWKWFDNLKPSVAANKDTVIVTFRANMATAIALRGYSIGDTLQVRDGYGGTANVSHTKAMVRSGLTGTVFTATDTVIASVGKKLNYQYYLVKSGNDVRESFYDFDYVGADVSQQERRKMNVTSKSLTVYDTTTNATDMRRMPRFRNLAHLSKAVKVTYTVNLKPAYYQVAKGDTLTDIQGSNNITKSSNIKQLGVIINGPATGGWAGWGPALASDTAHKMYDDGTHGDAVAGDSIYSIQIQYPVTDYVGQEFKFGIGGSDNEGGKGGYGNNHIENIDDSQTTAVIASDWGSMNPKFYNAWDFTLHQRLVTGVDNQYGSVPLAFTLNQNYPNPFNPSTTIQFTIPTQDIVTLKIFNVLGQEVITLMHEKMEAGKHTVRFDASNLTSGVYLYQVSAGKFVETKKMVLLK